MNQSVFDQVLAETEKSVKGFVVDEWKNRGLFQRFGELYEMINGYEAEEEQKIYLFRRGVILLAVEAVHDIFPATDYFRKNPDERFTVFRTPGQEKHEGKIDEWVKIEKANWDRQGEAGGAVEEASLRGTWWD
ncbi:hypothetical protein [Spirochaeta isovalerica]|uniref:Uncharacterized protein n=1 Tax=Spirochaeta isovalerica TaxID=150 RepID=A0A841RDQ3_9SPIO|nr:hypothetical protein [Spirochaeta isovalerica]MBB6480979.1 hypothetical protein [Spirochaeta isovalerica]